MGNLLQEIKRRKVFRVAAIYAVVAWVLIQVADTIAPLMNLPDSAPRLVLFLLIILFPIALFLAWAYEVSPEGSKADLSAQPASPSSNNTDRKLIYATFALVLLVAAIQLSDRFLTGDNNSATRSSSATSATTNTSVMRASLILSQPLERISTGLRTVLDIAPDGSAMVYQDLQTGDWWLRNLATSESQLLLSNAGTSRAQFSPDSQELMLFIGSTSETNLYSSRGGSPRPLPFATVRPPSWLSNEEIIYQHINDSDEARIYSLADGTEELISGFDVTSMAGLFVVHPSETAFLYSSDPVAGSLSSREIHAFSLNDESTSLVTNDGHSPQFASSGHVLFMRDGDLWAVPFDSNSLAVTGVETKVLEGVDSTTTRTSYSISETGRLVYLPGTEYNVDQTKLYWADRMGNREEISLPPGNYNEPRLSPDGALLAIVSYQADGARDIWVHNLSRGTFNPVTFTGNARNPVWTPDGSQLVYQLSSDPQRSSPRGELWIMNADGTGQAERLLDASVKADAFSPIDGKLFCMIGGAGSGTPVNLDSLAFSDGAWVSEPLFRAQRNIFGARVSPDGRWIAYGSAEFGPIQIYVQPYPNLDGGRWQISTGEIGHREPSWGPNGDELFFLRLDGTLMRTEITIQGNSLSSDIAEPLVTDLEYNSATTPNYLMSNDGERFLHFYDPDEELDTGIDQDHAELVVIENFTEELKRLAPTFSQ